MDSSEKTPSGPISGVYVWPELLPVEDATQKKLCLFLHAVPDRNPGPSSMDLVLVLLSSVFVNIREDDKVIGYTNHFNLKSMNMTFWLQTFVLLARRCGKTR